jgi:hypothetical protein
MESMTPIDLPVRARCLAGFAVLVISVGLSACSTSTPPLSTEPQPESVVLVGDSLAEQAAPYLEAMLEPIALVPRFFGGTAPCDWLERDLGITASSVVVISFTGNSTSPCMSDGVGGHLQGQAVLDKYQSDVDGLIVEALTVGARVVLVVQPAQAESLGGNLLVAGLNEAYTERSTPADIDLVDAGAAVENVDGTFAQALPCLPGEEQCDPSGSNVVRSDDGLHFCPGSPPPGPCPVYSSGAFRFAQSIADAVNQP